MGEIHAFNRTTLNASMTPKQITNASVADNNNMAHPFSDGFGRPPLAQMLIDLAALGAAVLLACAAVAAIGAGVFILFFSLATTIVGW